MLLQEACRFTQDISAVPITVFAAPADAAAYCHRWQFHAVQGELDADVLWPSLQGLGADEVICLIDKLRIRFVTLKIGGVPVVLGPYCTELMTERDYQLLRQRFHLPELPVRDFLTYRGQLAARSEEDVLHLASCLLSHTGCVVPSPVLRRIDTAETDEAALYSETALRKAYPLQVEERYKIELEFMENIRRGDRNAALASWKQLHSLVSFLKTTTGRTLENARVSAAVNRTTIRLAASEVGLPAVLNDALSGESAAIVRTATTVSEIDAEHDRLIRAYCKAIHEYHTHRYTTLVLSAIHALDHHYREEVSIADLAEELEVSENHLIRTFKRETGTTPGQYLLAVRMRQAARLLRDRDLQVQRVSAAVGISDSNYFTKLFRAHYGETPQSYQKHSRL